MENRPTVLTFKVTFLFEMPEEYEATAISEMLSALRGRFDGRVTVTFHGEQKPARLVFIGVHTDLIPFVCTATIEALDSLAKAFEDITIEMEK